MKMPVRPQQGLLHRVFLSDYVKLVPEAKLAFASNARASSPPVLTNLAVSFVRRSIDMNDAVRERLNEAIFSCLDRLGYKTLDVVVRNPHSKFPKKAEYRASHYCEADVYFFVPQKSAFYGDKGVYDAAVHIRPHWGARYDAGEDYKILVRDLSALLRNTRV